jgi:hypothetical protein
VRPRLDVTKLYWHRDGQHEVRECIFKVSWSQVEPNRVGPGLPRQRRTVAGTTLAIDWKTRQVRAILQSDQGRQQQADRDELLRNLLAADLLRVGDEALGLDGRPLQGVVRGDVILGVLRVQSAARVLHITPAGRR